MGGSPVPAPGTPSALAAGGGRPLSALRRPPPPSFRPRPSSAAPPALLLAVALALALVPIAPVGAVLNLRCCVVTERPFIYEDSTGAYAGATMEYYHSLRARTNASDATAGLQCVSATGVAGPEAFVTFPTFSGLVEHFAQCAPRPSSGRPNTNTSACVCDIGAVSAARNTDRNSKVDFVAPMFFDSLALIQRTSALSAGGNTLFFLKPFSKAVWLGLAALLFLHVFVTLFDRNFAPPSRTDAPPPSLARFPRIRHALLKTALLRRARYAFFATAFGLVGHSNEAADAPGKARPTTRQRFLALLAIVFGTFLLLTYESGLVLQLFLGEPLSSFRDINDLKTCRIPAPKVCIVATGNEAQFWNASISPARRNANCTHLYPTWTYPDPDRDAYTVGLANVAADAGTCEYFMASNVAVQTAANTQYCGNLSVVGNAFLPSELSYILPKNSPHTQPLSKATLDLQRADAIEDPISFAVTSPCQVRAEAQLTWRQLGPFFCVSYAFLGIMVLFMCAGNLLAVKSERVRDFTEAHVGGEADAELGCREKEVKRKWRGSSAKGRRRSARSNSDHVDADAHYSDAGAPSNLTSDTDGITNTDLSAPGSATTVDANATTNTDLSAVGSATTVVANAGS